MTLHAEVALDDAEDIFQHENDSTLSHVYVTLLQTALSWTKLAATQHNETEMPVKKQPSRTKSVVSLNPVWIRVTDF